MLKMRLDNLLEWSKHFWPGPYSFFKKLTASERWSHLYSTLLSGHYTQFIYYNTRSLNAVVLNMTWHVCHWQRCWCYKYVLINCQPPRKTRIPQHSFWTFKDSQSFILLSFSSDIRKKIASFFVQFLKYSIVQSSRSPICQASSVCSWAGSPDDGGIRDDPEGVDGGGAAKRPRLSSGPPSSSSSSSTHSSSGSSSLRLFRLEGRRSRKEKKRQSHLFWLFERHWPPGQPPSDGHCAPCLCCT